MHAAAAYAAAAAAAAAAEPSGWYDPDFVMYSFKVRREQKSANLAGRGAERERGWPLQPPAPLSLRLTACPRALTLFPTRHTDTPPRHFPRPFSPF